MGQLNPDWVIRNLEERDYGIDLQLELFDGDNPTGHMALVQVKGTEKSFADEPSAKIPVKTLHYAELFSIPFFLFRTSLENEETEFIWLQKFISTELEITNPKWRTKKHLKVQIPEPNKLSSNEKKFRSIVEQQLHHREALSFIRLTDSLRRFLLESLSKERAKSTAEVCLFDLRELKELINFLIKESGVAHDLWKKELDELEFIMINLLADYENNTVSTKDMTHAGKVIDALDATMRSYLVRDNTYRMFVHASKKIRAKFAIDPPF